MLRPADATPMADAQGRMSRRTLRRHAAAAAGQKRDRKGEIQRRKRLRQAAAAAGQMRDRKAETERRKAKGRKEEESKDGKIADC